MVKFWFFYLQAGTVNRSSKKLTRSKLFRLYLITKKINGEKANETIFES